MSMECSTLCSRNVDFN